MELGWNWGGTGVEDQCDRQEKGSPGCLSPVNNGISEGRERTEQRRKRGRRESIPRDFELFFEGQIAKDIEPNVLGYIRHGLSHRDRDHDIHIHRS